MEDFFERLRKKRERKKFLAENKTFKCKHVDCGIVFQTFLERKNHYLIHLKTLDCKEIDCDRKFTSFEERRKHYKNEHFKMACHMCKRKLLRRENRTRHTERCAKNLDANPA